MNAIAMLVHFAQPRLLASRILAMEQNPQKEALRHSLVPNQLFVSLALVTQSFSSSLCSTKLNTEIPGSIVLGYAHYSYS